jgi:glycosyltransferase involved in cell wall biosynthesis
MRILVLSRYSRLGASSRVRIYQYIPYLEAQGFHVTVAPLLGDGYVMNLYAGRRKDIRSITLAYIRRLRSLLTRHRYDLLWIEKELFPWLPSWGEMLLARMAIPYVVDYDDAIFHRYDMHPSRLVRALLGSKIDRVMRQAALVIAGNDYLAERARRAGSKRVECLPSVIDLNRYHSTPLGGQGVFTIGWIGTPLTAKYLHLVHSALGEVCQRNKGRLVVVGSGKIELDGVPTEIHAWSEETEVAEIQGFDVGIMPIPDEPWERGKCSYKLVQYMACGRPVVASPVGANNHIVENGVNGFLASTTGEWIGALRTLRDDLKMRDRMGRAARSKIEAQYSLQATEPRLASLLRSVMGSGVNP